MHPIVKTVGRLSAATPSDRAIQLTRTFDAPRQLVWDAHTRPELVRRWMVGPRNWSMPVCDIDLRVGGTYRYEWHDENGLAMALSGTYREIEAPRYISDTQMFDDDWTKGPADTAITFAERDGRTEMTLDIVYASKEARDFALSIPMVEGMEAGYERLERIPAKS